MNIYFSESSSIDPRDSRLLPVLEELRPEFPTLSVATEPHPARSFADAQPLLEQMDGMIANFHEPDELLRQKVLYAHSLGKSILVGMKLTLDPEEVLSEIAKPPYLAVEKRLARSYVVQSEADTTRAMDIRRNGLGKMHLHIFLQSQAMAECIAKKLAPPTEEFVTFLSDGSRHGAEADQLTDE